MKSKEYIENVLKTKVNQFVDKNNLQKDLQEMLNTRNRFEKGDFGDDTEPYNFCMFFTNGDVFDTAHLCDIRIDFLKTRNKNIIYVTGYEILHYTK